MNTFFEQLKQHSAQYAVIGTLVAAAIARHMPEAYPRSLDAWWTWFRSSTQEIANQRNGNPIQPGSGPAQQTTQK
jgi:hypothetical protein